jgi:hypothetical protein
VKRSGCCLRVLQQHLFGYLMEAARGSVNSPVLMCISRSRIVRSTAAPALTEWLTAVALVVFLGMQLLLRSLQQVQHLWNLLDRCDAQQRCHATSKADRDITGTMQKLLAACKPQVHHAACRIHAGLLLFWQHHGLKMHLRIHRHDVS